MRLNILFLLLVAFLPIPTRIVAQSLHERLAPERVDAVVYGCTLLAIRLMFFLMDTYSRLERLQSPGTVEPDLREERREFRFVAAGYVITIALAFFVPLIAVGLYFAIAIVLIVPFRAVGRLLAGKRPE